MNPGQGIAAVARRFQFHGEVSVIAPLGNGHINDTWCVTCSVDGATSLYILQRINRKVFRDPGAVMQNIERVTAHVAAQVVCEQDSARRVLALIPAQDGRSSYVDAERETWRAYRYIANARTCESAASPQQAREAARAFGRFQQQLVSLPAPRLNETILDFHNTPKRFITLQQLIAADPCNRAILAKPEIEFALSHESLANVLLNVNLPERVAHNDTKVNNVMFDDASGEAICVIDLDTVMPGLALYDFGDMVRSTTTLAQEDEQDLSKVSLEFPFFEALVRGYLETTRGFLTPAEKDHLVAAGKLLTFEQGIRFLADYLAGDPYYKVHRLGHNLDRCRTQLKLVLSMEQQEDAMTRLVESTAG